MKHLAAFLIFLTFLSNSKAQSWKTAYSNLNMIDLGGGYYFAAGANGLIVRSNDDGNTWQSLEFPSSLEEIRGIDFQDSVTGFVVADKSINYTNNLGKSWMSKYHNSQILRDIEIKSRFGVAVGDSGSIIISQDSGRTWNKSILYFHDYIDVNVVDSVTAFAISSSGTFIRTTDAGKNWTYINTYLASNPYKVHFINKNIGWIVCVGGEIGKSSDGGTIWTEISNVPGTLGIKFTSSSYGWIVGKSGNISKTTNGGNNWQSTSTSLYSNENILDIVASGSIVIAVGSKSLILKSENNGTTWTNKLPDVLYGFSTNVKDIFFLNKKVGWACIGENLNMTIDGGKVFYKQQYLKSEGYQKIFFTDTLNGFVLGLSSQLLKTNDGGLNWDTLNISISNIYTSIYCLNPKQIFLGGVNGVIRRSLDSGKNWTKLNTGRTERINDIFFTSDSIGYAALDAGLIGSSNRGIMLKTTNQGTSWAVKVLNIGENTKTIRFINKFKGFYTSGGKIYMTTDEGENWQLVHSSSTYSINSIKFIDSLQGYACGSNSTIIYTTNGGLKWNYYNLSQSETLNCIWFSDKNNIWVGGNNNFIYRYNCPLPATPIFSSGLDSICQGDSPNLKFLNNNYSGFNYVINDTSIVTNTSGILNYNFQKEGKYIIKTYGKNSCGISDGYINNLVVNPSPIAKIAVLKDSSFCKGDSAEIIIDTSNIKIVRWYLNNNEIPNFTFSNIISKATGIYKVEIMGKDNCKNISREIKINAFQLPNKPTISKSSNKLISSSANEYKWYLNDTLINNSNIKEIVALKNGNYRVKITDQNGCENISDGFLFNSVGINGLKSNSTFIYPNPVEDIVNINSSVYLDKISIVDLSGKIILIGCTESQSCRELNLSHLKVGTYILIIESDDFQIRRFLINKI